MIHTLTDMIHTRQAIYFVFNDKINYANNFLINFTIDLLNHVVDYTIDILIDLTFDLVCDDGIESISQSTAWSIIQSIFR